MILAGDIGGTKTVLALFSGKNGIDGGAIHTARYESGKYSCIEAIIVEFLRDTRAKPLAAGFGVAGPVRRQRARVTNLPWIVDSEIIAASVGIPHVRLINDLQAIAMAVPHLSPQDIHTLNQGRAVSQGNIAVVAPGTGLGMAYLVWTGERYKACASEGGHAAFSPVNPQQVALLAYLQQRYGHVSLERICSGGYLPNIYDFLIAQGRYPEPEWLREELATAVDPTPVIVQAALTEKAEICKATLDMFVQVLGTVVGNVAVTLLPTGGIYLGGGIPPRILTRLQQPDFLNAVSEKGRFSALCADMPIHVILNPDAALLGAAWFGLASF